MVRSVARCCVIVEFLLDLVETVVSFLVGLIPPLPLPGFLLEGGGIDNAASSAAGYLAPLALWVPFADIAAALTIVIGCVVAGIGVRIVRVLISHFTGGGGAS